MPDRVKTLVARIRALEDELEEEFQHRREALSARVENGRVMFDKELERRHDELRTQLFRYIAGSRPLIMLTAPVIYSVIFPFLLLDLFVTVYQAACFPVYGIEKVRRRDHIVFDRHRLRYLNGLEKLNCSYCSYGNGLLSYAAEIASRTEEYWCPIKHAQRIANAHRRYPQFAEYGDADGYRERVERLNRRLTDTS